MSTWRPIVIFLLLAAGVSASDRTYRTCAPGRTDMAIAYGDIVSCSTTSVTEQDLYRFTAVANDQIYVKVLGPNYVNNAACAELLSPTGVSIWSGCRFPGATLTLVEGGQYTLRVYEYLSDQLMTYSFALERRFPVPLATKPIRFGTPISASLILAPDYDYYEFAGIAGDRIRIDATGPNYVNNAICIGIDYYDPGRTSLASDCRTSTHFDLTLPKTGSFFVTVWEYQEDQTADYALEMTCLFGTCRDNPFPSLTTTLTGCTACRVGETFAGRIALVNTTTPLRASELKLGFIAPDGAPINIGDPHVEVGENFTFDGEVIRTFIKPEQAKGEWQFCANLIETNLGTLRLSSCQKFTVQ